VGISAFYPKQRTDRMTNLQNIPIQDLIPQRPPFIMIDALTHYDEVVARTKLNITTDNIFVKNNTFTEAGVMENIAQTCAARIGYVNKFLLSNKIKLGFIGAIKNLVIEALPNVGDTLDTTVEVVSEVFAITLVNAKVETNGKLIASCEMKISLTDIDSMNNG
jgi:3-hydroxymyristoyl/3-hydroxydecanoyl-(acyl carrier protein) dehydratase